MTFFSTHRATPVAQANSVHLSWLERLAHWADQHGERHRHHGSYFV
jgi:hypothetical protein